MSSIRVERLSFAYSDSISLLSDVELHVGRGFTGIVGENGAGKSTLLRLITSSLAPTAGRVAIEPADALVASCPQDVIAPPVHDVEGRLRGRLGLTDDQLARWDTLSPGERRRWQIGAALSVAPDVLLLDEPTNHVDASCRALLVAALARFDGIGLVISHDRALLDKLTAATIRVHAGTARLYPGSYSAAKQTWEADEERARELRGDAQRQARRASKQLADARRDRQQADASRSASRRKKGPKDHDATTLGATTLVAWAEARHGRNVEVARHRVERATAAIPDAPAARALGRSVFVGYERAPRRWLFELEAAVIPPVLRDIKVVVGARDRIRIAGDNGAGKTTLIGALLASHRLPADRVLYLPQELDADLRGELRALSPDVRGRTLSLVAALGVDPDRLLASEAPSPGELRKLALALGLGRHVWCLVLDEPTNHLDLPSIERLEAALAEFPGAIVLVTHDDQFAASCTETTWHVEEGRVRAQAS